MKELKETAALMTSADYKERFTAEYYQLETRYLKLYDMIVKCEKKTLDFTPACPIGIYKEQAIRMKNYLKSLVKRSFIEGVNIEIDNKVKKVINVDEYFNRYNKYGK